MTYIRLLVVIVLASVGWGRLAAQENAADAAGATSADNAPWKSLFDGKSLKGWEVVKGYDYEDQGKVEVQDGCLVIGTGRPATGVRWTEAFPKTDYEIEMDGKRVAGSDFFCGLSFPVGDNALTLILGGWGGQICGISSIDYQDAANNETTKVVEFKPKTWYHVRMRILPERLKAWLDGEQIVDVDTKDRKVDIRIDISESVPFGVATYQTVAAYKSIRVRRLTEEEVHPKD